MLKKEKLIENQIYKLEELMFSYLCGAASLGTLRDFSWEVIEYYTNASEKDLLTKGKRENEFWYAIWLIQHVADEEHENDGTAERLLKEALEFLRGEKNIPESCRGNRP